MSSVSIRTLYPLLYLGGLGMIGIALDLHLLMHLAIVGMALFLAVVSFKSYLRMTTTKLLLISLAFIFLASQELLVLAEAMSILTFDPSLIMIGSRLEVSHVLTLLSLGFFSGGLFRGQ